MQDWQDRLVLARTGIPRHTDKETRMELEQEEQYQMIFITIDGLHLVDLLAGRDIPAQIMVAVSNSLFV